MKKVIVVAIALVMMSCNGVIGNGFKISGEIKGLTDGTKVFLEKQDEKLGTVAVDTVKIEKGKFVFEGQSKEPEMHTIRFENPNTGLAVVVEKGNIKVVGLKDSIAMAKVSGTDNNEELNIFNQRAFKMQKKMMDFQQTNMVQIQEAQKTNDTVALNKLRKQFEIFQKDFVADNNKYIETHPDSFLSVLVIEGMLNEFEPKFDLIKKFYDGLGSDMKKTKPGRKIKTKLDGLNAVSVGQKAPEFAAPNPEGKMVTLKESLGKATIIDFWASWCEPCRKKSPEFVALYSEFHDKGLNFIGVALEKKGERIQWKEAIAKDKLNWIHVSNLQYWQDPIALKYSVEGIPSTFLLDKNGVIVGKNLSMDELKTKLTSMLAQ